MLPQDRLDVLLESFPKMTIGLVGDLFLDRYLMIEPGVEEISVETGLEAYQIQTVRNFPGALGTVMNNLTALGVGQLIPVTVIGDDGHGYDLLREVEKLPADTRGIVRSAKRVTPTYTKPMKLDANQQWSELNRLDVRSREPLDDGASQLVQQHLRDVFAAADGLVVLDQIDESNWGVVNEELRRVLHALSESAPEKPILVDSRSHIGHFHSGILKGNLSEFLAVAGIESHDHQQVVDATTAMSLQTGSPTFCTMGTDGILVTFPDQSPIHVPGLRVDGPVDICGAGDSVTSGLILSLLGGATGAEAAALANLVASVTVQQIGVTGTATPRQVRERFVETAGC